MKAPSFPMKGMFYDILPFKSLYKFECKKYMVQVFASLDFDHVENTLFKEYL